MSVLLPVARLGRRLIKAAVQPDLTFSETLVGQRSQRYLSLPQDAAREVASRLGSGDALFGHRRSTIHPTQLSTPVDLTGGNVFTRTIKGHRGSARIRVTTRKDTLVKLLGAGKDGSAYRTQRGDVIKLTENVPELRAMVQQEKDFVSAAKRHNRKDLPIEPFTIAAVDPSGRWGIQRKRFVQGDALTLNDLPPLSSADLLQLSQHSQNSPDYAQIVHNLRQQELTRMVEARLYRWMTETGVSHQLGDTRLVNAGIRLKRDTLGQMVPDKQGNPIIEEARYFDWMPIS